MEYNTIINLLDEICFNFNKPKISDRNRLEHFARKLSYVKEDAFGGIAKHFEGLSSFPANLLLEIQTAYAQWEEEQPLNHRKTECATCNGYGLLMRKEYDPGYMQTYTYISRCPACQNWKPHTGTYMPLAQLDKYKYSPCGNGWHRERKDAVRTECNACSSTGYLRSLEIIPKPEWRIRSVEPKPRPVSWTCPYCDNWEIGEWEIGERKDPPNNDILARCIPSDKDFSDEYEQAMAEMLKKLFQRKAA